MRWRGWVAVAAIIGREFAGPEAPPAALFALRLGEAAAAELAAIPDIPALAAEDAAALDAAPEKGAGMAEFAAQLASYCRAGASFDPAKASPAELWARAAANRYAALLQAVPAPDTSCRSGS